jgi:diacylglycerol kinase family enzyme
MSDRKRSQPALFKSLRRKQRRHEALLGKVEKTAARLERRKAKFQALEASIADLEHRLSEPRMEHLGQQAASDGVLKHARLIFNPASGRDDENNAARLAHVVSSLRAHGIEAHVGLKTSGNAARELARKAVARVTRWCGGGRRWHDRGRRLAAHRQLHRARHRADRHHEQPRALAGVPLDIEDACALIGMGTTRHIDVGRVTSNDSSQADYFMECAGVGLSAIAALAGQSFEKRRWGAIPRILRKFVEAKLGTIRVEMDDIVVEASTRIVTVSNAPLMGDNMLAAPGAKMDDGLLDVQIYDGMGDAELVKHFMAASSGSPDALKTYRARRVRITAEEPVLANSDMNITRERHIIDIEIMPKALSMIVGNGIGLSVPVESAPHAPTFALNPPHTNGATGPTLASPAPARM